MHGSHRNRISELTNFSLFLAITFSTHLISFSSSATAVIVTDVYQTRPWNKGLSLSVIIMAKEITGKLTETTAVAFNREEPSFQSNLVISDTEHAAMIKELRL